MTAFIINIFGDFFWLGLVSRILLLASHRRRGHWARLPVIHAVTFLTYNGVLAILIPFDSIESYWDAIFLLPMIGSALFWLMADYLVFVPKLRL